MIKIYYYGNFLSKHGINPTPAEQLVPLLKDRGVEVSYASSCRNKVLRFFNMFLLFFRSLFDKGVTVLDLYSGKNYFTFAVFMTMLHVVFRREYCLVLHGGGLLKKYLNGDFFLDFILKHAKHIVAPSHFYQSVFSNFQVTYIPNGIFFEKYKWTAGNRKHIMFLRAFHEYYDPLTLIRAFALVLNEVPDARLDMYGYDEDGTKGKAARLILDLDIHNSVQLKDRVLKEDIPKLGMFYGVFVNSSIVDNTPVSTIEAMAMGMGIVATKVGGIPYLLRHGETALLVEPKSPNSMAAAILRLIKEEELYGYLSENAREFARQMDWENVINLWIKLLN